MIPGPLDWVTKAAPGPLDWETTAIPVPLDWLIDSYASPSGLGDGLMYRTLWSGSWADDIPGPLDWVKSA